MTSRVADRIGTYYSRVFARPGWRQRINHLLFHLALRGMGYNNGWEPTESGESLFLAHLMVSRKRPFVIDVGANVGEYAAMVRLFNTESVVHCYEPNPGALKQLLKRFEQDSRVEVFGYALSDRKGYAVLLTESEDSELATLMPSSPLATMDLDPIKVDTRTLNDLYYQDEGPIDLLKIDVEGWEWEVLKGAKTILGQVHAIQIEMNVHQMQRGHTLAMFAELLNGFDVYQLLPRGIRKVDPNLPENNVFCYGNFVFVNRGRNKTT